MKKLLLVLLLFPMSLRAEVGIVKIDSLSVTDSPRGSKVGKVLFNQAVPVYARFSNWVKVDKGWIDADFLKVEEKEKFEFVGKVRRKLALVEDPIEAATSNGTINIPPNSYIMLGLEKEGKIFGMYKGLGVSVNASRVKVKEGVFDLVVFKEDVVLVNRESNPSERVLRLSLGTPAILIGDGLVASNFRFGFVKPVEPEAISLDKQSVIATLNNFIDVFNTAKASGALASRMGYYCKTEKLTEDDVNYVDLDSGRIGVYINLKYKFFDLNGKPLSDRKARLILKLGNEAFWQKVSKLILSKVPQASFVQINIERFSPEGYRKLGFIAVGRTQFKEGICELNPKEFMELVQHEINDDLWFFAEAVYREMENNEH